MGLCRLVQARLERVNIQMSKNKQEIQELAIRMKSNPDDDRLRGDSAKLIKQSSVLFDIREFLQTMLRKISSKLDEEDGRDGSSDESRRNSSESDNESDLFGLDAAHFTDYASDFDNLSSSEKYKSP